MLLNRTTASLLRPCPLSLSSHPFSSLASPSAAGAFLRPRSLALTNLRTYNTKTPGDKVGPEVLGQGEFQRLTWEGYLAKRKYRKRAEILVAIPTTLLGLFLGISYFADQQVDPTVPIFGLEPVWVYMGATVLSGLGGYLVGPPLGAAAWRLYNRKWSRALEEMDTRFYAHVAKNRADPGRQTLSSSSHPLPDFYGEKIDSLSSYRKWLRAQYKYKRTYA